MTKIELLMWPRWRVTADFWRSPFKIGEILIAPGNKEAIAFNDDATIIELDLYKDLQANKFHHLFKHLPWFIDRKLEDMPQYLKHNYVGGYYAKVTEHFINKYECAIEDDRQHDNSPGIPTGPRTAAYAHWIPSTEKEYKAYLKEQKSVTHE